MQTTNPAEVIVRRLDVRSNASVAEFARWLAVELGGVDIIVNNAGVAEDRAGAGGAQPPRACHRRRRNPTPRPSHPLEHARDSELNEGVRVAAWAGGVDAVVAEAERCLDVNFHGVRRVCGALLPSLLRPGGRMVVVSSSVGKLGGGSGCPIIPAGDGFSAQVRDSKHLVHCRVQGLKAALHCRRKEKPHRAATRRWTRWTLFLA